MSKFVQEVVLEPIKFDGDVITCKVRPLKRKLYLQVLPQMQVFNTVKTELTEKLGAAPTKEQLGADPRVVEAVTKSLDILEPVFKEHVIEFKGPKDANGADVSLDTVMEAAYFTQLAVQLVMGLVNAASVSEDSEGKSAGPSGT